MADTSRRLLRLLSLLQTCREWSGAELAERLGVTTRTIRRDIGRLRDLGYPVHTSMGPVGGYRLRAGATLPPLLLDDDEAVAVAIGLHVGTVGGVAGIQEAALRALTKVRQMLPSRLRHRVAAVERAVVTLPPRYSAAVDAEVLTAISAAIQASETLRFDYVDHAKATSRRRVEPHRLAYWGGRWYLIGWDVDRADWRTFRVDRITPRTPNGPRFTPRALPEGDAAAYLRRSMEWEIWPYRCRLLVHAPAAAIIGRVEGVVTPVDDTRCRLELATDSFDIVAMVMGSLDVAFEVESPPELADRLRVLAARFTAATGG